ncbi:CoA-binding protein [Metallosphaera tengchongensis]|uniref:CoA-binding protein n=1 Tax=Metallosphaera tengchongensis TaxID=1532350 RepID=A0A6N0NVR4_9CREN|nr:CoA-binding protein [Metallosphaera tengchongensis]QKQ99230.1 CoA-binding protein [Metallosphaera tengchongensis]
MESEEELIRYILTNFKKIATIGFSKDPEKPSHRVPKFLIEHGYVVYPVNPTMTEVLGRKVYPSLGAVPEDVEVVQVFRPSRDVPMIVNEVLKRKNDRGDVKALWLQEGIRDDQAAEKARAEGLMVIQDRCMYKEYVRLFDGS